MKKEVKKNIIKNSFIFVIMLVFSIILLMYYPEKINPVTSIMTSYFLEMIFVLPAVVLFMGLFSVFIPNKLVIDYLGRASGIKGMFIAILLGTLPTGPLYIAFPLAALWLKKGASISNIIVFLSAWACIKIPQEIIEFQFLGLKFMLLRLILTIIFVMIMGLVIEKIIKLTDKPNVIG
ncbi:hypothetical protein HN695_07080 [Candidatus Woesearchaeota archaeon]|jgi:uncharacterized membrane protein YraQ (UPF0718 family)|nr:hypothetical protein [Candidatus Woesearchaeota archaeon]MBT6040986.1 hypothetical protein [Candidatus Woesearchaeota archaeon]MBT6336124.1 hypothetical protein [Candidatus Woesearchaeota archaeon]MBT7928069.1 hypothetical protein [Candidatus Woesearchaeota archaeon]